MTIRPAGDRALLVEPNEPAALDALVDALHATDLPGVGYLLPAAATVLITLTPDADPVAVTSALHTLQLTATESAPTSTDADVLIVPVRYDGADLAVVANLLGVDPTTVIARHTGTIWRCRFVGFTAGFGYLTAPDAELTVPRRAQSRTAVPAGAVALADGYSAVYPRRSPGGWQLIGHTDLAMWDLTRPRPALLTPGHRVRFAAVER
ncbi:allophanate hydrolase subunit 1 [Skermania piniformis]|uniref:Allophanate hydrolase subunit 1 n=1 Tax=Skermania pinensis TaxID=39122 RepID=A0ABX8SD69_9ACTN|nr:allophanate hydrolase subunit 1 [Skermania piniformis]QXQ15839.1 allophanate hydrolase subunit 1 [Skermania piniformis]